MEARHKPIAQRALADIHYNMTLADQGTSSEDESPGPPSNDESNAIGVSIGREQTYLLSTTTPAAEKAAAINNASGYFDGVLDNGTPPITESPQEELSQDQIIGDRNRAEQPPARGQDNEQSPQPPSPWRIRPRPVEGERFGWTRSVLRDGFSFGRRRASSGPDSRSKSLIPSLPSLPKTFSISSALSGYQRDNGRDDTKISRKRSFSRRRSTLGEKSSTPLSGAQTPTQRTFTGLDQGSPQLEPEEERGTLGELPSGPQLQHARPGLAVLRRSTSDTSLVTQRTMSRVSSLGDDTRFEHVSEQVNSRLKAIKDSFQDSKINLPSMPSMPSMPNFNVSSFTPDFLNRDRSGSASIRSSQRLGGSLQHVKHVEKPIDPMTRQPYMSAKAAIADAPLDKGAIDHPHFNRALEQLEGDIVVLGGYRGSILRSAEPPHRQLWVPMKVGLNLRKVDLEVGIEEDGDERASEKVIPGGMLTHIGPVDISRRLLKRLRSCENARQGRLRVHEYGYDWRLDPSYLSKQFLDFLTKLPSNRPGVSKPKKGALVIAHSLGGLITRHAVNQQPEYFSGVVYAGVPTTCVNILGPLRNGDEVLLSSRVLTAQVNFTIRTSFALLPLNGHCFIDKKTKKAYPIDFFDPNTWIEHRLSPCVGRPLPPLSAPPKPTGLASYVNSVTNALPTLPIPGRRSSKTSTDPQHHPSATPSTTAGGAAAPDTLDSAAGSSATAITNGNLNTDTSNDSSIRTAVTIPHDKAVAYLTRTLASIKSFKLSLAHQPAHKDSNAYPPLAVIYGKSTPTVIGAKVDGIEGIKHADAYDELAFASGDGVVLARAAMVPEGYRTVRGGVVSSERGHVTLLGDLEAVGRCINAVVRARRKGVGWGEKHEVGEGVYGSQCGR